MVADLDPVEAGTVTLGIPTMLLGKIRLVTVPVTFNPRTNTVFLEFPYQGVTYRQHWDTPHRAALLTALSRYQNDFDARNLPSQSRPRMRKAYGAFVSTTEWGQFKFMIRSRAYPNVELGYVFHQNSPYFLITQWSSKNVNNQIDRSESNSLRLNLYLTRAMTEELANALNQEKLLSYLPSPSDFVPPPSGTVDITPDEY
jgi:hypothetical protein